MNGAESLIRSLANAGVDVCFANPGTSEMHLVQAIDAVSEVRPVLAMFEGVCTGAADGYGRMTGKPAMTLLHLGPGLGSGIANLHNARRASTPIINLVGNHALYHVEHDAPLTSDIDTLAKNVSSYIKSDSTAETLAADGMQALARSMTSKPGSQGQISTMIIPADACWNEAEAIAASIDVPARPSVDADRIKAVAGIIDATTVILLNSTGLTTKGLIAANRIAEKTGCRVEATTFPARIDSGAGQPYIARLPYFPEHVMGYLQGVGRIVLAGAEVPVSFFAYPNTAGLLIPDGCEVVRLAESQQDVVAALEDLAREIDAPETYRCNDDKRPQMPEGELNAASIAAVVANLLPEDAIVCGDSGGGGAAFVPCQSAAKHTWLNLTGGSIGQGGPVAVGAAVACPDSRVLALLGDGAFMYTNQALWTQAREKLNVTTVIYNNSIYGILETEYLRLGVNEIGRRAASMFDLSNPAVNHVDIARGMGVDGERVDTLEGFIEALTRSFAQSGPYLIEAML